MGNALQHQTVLLNEAVDALVTRADGVYVDGTFGRGGHSRAVLAKLGEAGRLIAFDKDPQAIETARAIGDQRFEIVCRRHSSTIPNEVSASAPTVRSTCEWTRRKENPRLTGWPGQRSRN